MNSEALINKANQAYKNLRNKRFEWPSFYNGYLQGFVEAIAEHDKEIISIIDEMIDREKNDKYQDVNYSKARIRILTELKEKLNG